MPLGWTALQKQSTEGYLPELVNIFLSFHFHRDGNVLIGEMLELSIKIAHAEGGTFYRVVNQQKLTFGTFISNVLNSDQGQGSPDNPLSKSEFPLFNGMGDPIHTHICCSAYHNKKAIHLEDVYGATEFDCSGVKAFDKANCYKTRAILTVPILGINENVIGIMQLVNARDQTHTKHKDFSSEVQQVISTLATIVGFQVDNLQLVDALKLEIKMRELAEFEKTRLLRDLHDGLGSVLTKASINFQNGTVPAIESIKAIDSALKEMRQICNGYSNYQESIEGMVALVISQYIDVFKVAKDCVISYDFMNPNQVRDGFKKELIINLMQVLREFLTNSLKYSNAKSMHISISIMKELLILDIEEGNVDGLEPTLPQTQRHGFGQMNIHHRINSLLGGELVTSENSSLRSTSISIPTLLFR